LRSLDTIAYNSQIIVLFTLYYRMYEERMTELDREVEMINDGNTLIDHGH
jgi:hypothetical protein